MRQAQDNRHGPRRNALIVVVWRAGLRIHEALALTETEDAATAASVLKIVRLDHRTAGANLLPAIAIVGRRPDPA